MRRRVRVLQIAELLYLSGYSLLQQPQSTTALSAIRVAKDAGVFCVLDVVPHRVFGSNLAPDYWAALESVDAVILDLGTAKRLLGTLESSEDEIVRALLQRYKVVILRPTNDHQIIADRQSMRREATGYGTAEDKTGYLDRVSAATLFGYLSAMQRQHSHARGVE